MTNCRRFIRLLVDCLCDWLGDVARPGDLKVEVTGEVTVMIFDVLLPAVTAADVVRGELSVSSVVAGEVVSSLQLVDAGQSRVAALAGDENTDVSLSFVWVDDAGNKSEPSTLTVTLTDTIAPGKPGALSVQITGE